VEEVARAGFEDVVLIQGRGKTAIEDFFDVSYELEEKLEREGKTDWLSSLKNIRNSINVISIRQKRALGLGHAIWTARPVIGDEPFAVLLGDEIMINKESETPVIGQLAQRFANTGLSTVAMMKVPDSDTHKYGIVAGDTAASEAGIEVLRVRDVVEKPSVGTAPSNWALPGRYVFDAEILRELADAKPGKNGEIQLTDAMQSIAKQKGMLASTFVGRRYDAGDKLGYLQANIELALERDDLRVDLSRYLKSLAGRL
jgi:UTP--glucose-1-phosphate uridylyltransferase